jgi:hypothetical protein
MTNTRPEEVAEIVIGNHLASLAVFAVSNNATETLTKIEDMKKGLTKKLVDILDHRQSGD